MSDISVKEIIKNDLQDLINRYQDFISSTNKKDISEETIRTCINSLLETFHWDVCDTSEILQKKALSSLQKEKLKAINFTHSRPDYILMNGQSIKLFVDAKDLNVDIFTDQATAF